MQVGKTKDQGLYNKPLAAVHPGALAAGTLLQYNTIMVHNRRTTLSAAINTKYINTLSEHTAEFLYVKLVNTYRN